MEDNVKKEGSYLTGIIGAIIGGAIATIPWVLAYVYGNVMLSLLAVLIGAGEFYGYKIFRGKIDKKLPIVLSKEEMQELLDSIEINDHISSRNRCMFELMYATGLRVSELTNLTISSLNINMGYLKIIGKGDKERIVPLSNMARNILNDYLKLLIENQIILKKKKNLLEMLQKICG